MTSAFAMYDTMQYIKSKVSTVCVGQAASAGSLLLTAVNLVCVSPCQIHVLWCTSHQVVLKGRPLILKFKRKEILGLRKKLNDIYVHHTGQKLSEIEKVMERDTFMSADEAKKFGLIDHVVATREDIPKPKEDDKDKNKVHAWVLKPCFGGYLLLYLTQV